MEVRLKCENLQRAGSFKIRGAMNALQQLDDDQRARGVVAFSSGNHAQGVALSARLLGIPATIVMPENSVQSKVEATQAYGATVVQANVTSATRDTVAREIAEKNGAAVIPPFDDERIIAGAGTVGLEIAEDVPALDLVIVNVLNLRAQGIALRPGRAALLDRQLLARDSAALGSGRSWIR